jgi:hypothetical protein
MREMRNTYKMLFRKPEVKRLHVRPMCRWKDNIKRDLMEIGVDWMHLAQDRDQWQAVMNMVINL